MFRYILPILFFICPLEAFAQASDKQIASAGDILNSLEPVIPEQKPQKKQLLVGSAELGLLYKTGNTNSGDIKTGVDLRFEKGPWLSLLTIDLLIKKADILNDETGETHFQTTDQKWTISSQTNYRLSDSEQHYIYGNYWYEDNNFNSFVNQSSVSSGWGRHWYKTDAASLWADIGPGYKRDVIKETDTEAERIADAFIIQAQALYLRKLGENVEFKQYFSAKYAMKVNENSILKAESSVTTKLISTLQLKFTFTVDYNTKVDVDKENLDTQTAVTLVYSF